LSTFPTVNLDRSKIEELAQKIAGPTNDPYVLTAAEKLAEAQLELERIRTIRQCALAPIGETSLPITFDRSKRFDQVLTSIIRLDRYERRANARRRKAIKALDEARKLNSLTQVGKTKPKSLRKTRRQIDESKTRRAKIRGDVSN
jgi:hypothetical protein